MSLQPSSFDPRQEMQHPDFELQYKRDMHLNDVGLHHHDFYEIFFLISGDVTYTVNSRICKILPGDVLLISPRELHQVYIRSDLLPYERYVLWLTPEIIQRLSSEKTNLLRALKPRSASSVYQLRLRAEDQVIIRTLLSQIHRETQIVGYGSDLLCSSLISQLLVHINRLATQEGDYFEAVSSSSQFISRVIDYINDHYNESLSLDNLAAQFSVSKYHLSHEFNRQVGTSIYRYIQKKRLQVARQLLAQKRKPSQICTECGFGDYAGFYRAFKAEYGCGPREYVMSLPMTAQQKKRK